ncbi:MAG: homocysteine S-methyltransferase family protein [Marinicella sp.]
MSTFSNVLKNDQIYLTDGGLETTLIFHHEINLPHFSSFVLMSYSEGQNVLKSYYQGYLDLAKKNKKNFILETPTWRASSDWGDLIGYDAAELHVVNTSAVTMLRELQSAYSDDVEEILISGNIGPRSDGYQPTQLMTCSEAEKYHSAQVNSFAQAGVDMLCAMTISYVDEAIGIVLAAQKHKLPVCVSFTVETDGSLVDGTSLQQAIEIVDQATENGPIYYMINCAHPDHFSKQLHGSENWIKRIAGIRANASRKSHAELDDSETLDAGNPIELGQQYQQLSELLPNLRVLGGCCGTDENHINHICEHFHQ